jgi:hypothetical protein
MSTVSLSGLLIISLIAVAAPILAASVKRVKPPSAVVEIVAGIVVGPSVLAWVKIDQPVNVVALLGLAFLLFLAGLGIDLRATTPSQFRAPLAGFAASLMLGTVAGAAFNRSDLAEAEKESLRTFLLQQYCLAHTSRHPPGCRRPSALGYAAAAFLPLAEGALTTGAVVYGIGRIGASGRVADRSGPRHSRGVGMRRNRHERRAERGGRGAQPTACGQGETGGRGGWTPP